MLNKIIPEEMIAMLKSGDTDVGIASEKLMTEEQLMWLFRRQGCIRK
ncbi:hypothetical protein [Sodalis-like endosymbiont of Proechinophthirus fluctus]|nr:hypothetical protein [Sodalis-like endosymbiont of Proechinophthirus fluctus]